MTIKLVLLFILHLSSLSFVLAQDDGLTPAADQPKDPSQVIIENPQESHEVKEGVTPTPSPTAGVPAEPVPHFPEEPPFPAPAPLPTPYTTLEDIQKSFDGKRKPFFNNFKKALDAISAKQFGAAINFLRKTKVPSDYNNYFHFLSAQAENGLFKNQVQQNRKKQALATAERLRSHLLQVTNNRVSSNNLLKRSNVLLGEVDVLTAELLAHTSSTRGRAQLLFETGFQRLSQNGLLILIPQQSVVSYSMLCDRRPSLDCETWVEKLMGFLDKSEDVKLAEKIVALYPKKPKVKKPTTYSLALDVQAFSKGFFQYVGGDFLSAYETWYELLKSYPNTNIKLRTKFWMGRAAQKAGRELQAQTLFKEVIRDLPFAYYALLSSFYGNIDLSRNISGESPKFVRVPISSSTAEVQTIARAEDFIANGLPQLAAMELKNFQFSDAMPDEFLVYLIYLNHLAKAHRPNSQVWSELNNRSFSGLFSVFGEKILFPQTFLDVVKNHAKDYNMDPIIPLSIIKQESLFDAEAVSPAKAYGLMQIIKPTARDLEAGISVPALLDPDTNVRLGVKYIHSLLKKYQGNIVFALSAYNAGPHNCDRWRKEINSSLPIEEYIELIGYRETREYVQGILRNMYWYRRIVRGEKVQKIDELTKTEFRF